MFCFYYNYAPSAQTKIFYSQLFDIFLWKFWDCLLTLDVQTEQLFISSLVTTFRKWNKIPR